MSEAHPVWERWHEVDRLLDAALDHPESERVEAIRVMAGADHALAAVVLGLLERLQDSSRFENPASTFVADALASREPEALQPGEVVGRYRVLSPLGRGGMATVYLAERADGTYEQRVALKALRRGLDTEDLVRRFLAERQILSSLSHPHIARLLDGGSAPDGRPYLVMELVEGDSIVAWADTRQLDVSARLTLFLAVADAVDHAHRRLVVHRDIKPSNVLVDTQGAVKLLDFGIATLLDGDPVLTDIGRRPLTPSYASPEQVAGAPITTASDIYQAGLLLLELLTGMRALDASVRTSSRVASQAATVPASTPMTAEERAGRRATTPAALARRLRGDVDVILAKALREEPEERYPSMAAMAEDVRRHLGGLPITAHPASLRYRTRKFIARHPAVVPTLLLAAALLSGYIVTLARHNAALARERDAAALASARATETRDFLVNLFRSADPYAANDPERGRSITVFDALQLGQAEVNARLATQPALRADLLGTIGEVLKNLDQTKDAIATMRQVRDLRTQLGDTASPQVARDLEVLGNAFMTLGQADSAEAALQHGLRLVRTLSPPDSARLSALLSTQAVLLARTDLPRAIPVAQEAVAAARGVGGTVLAEALRKLADHHRSAGQLAESEATAREALGLYRAAEGDSTVRTGFALHTLGQTLAERRKFAEAGQLLAWSLTIVTRAMGPEHDLTMRMRNNLGVFYTLAEDHARAEATLRETLAVRVALHGPGAPELATVHQNLAANLLRQGRLAEAESSAVRAEELYRAAHGATGVLVAFPLLSRAEIALSREDAHAALRHARNAAEILRGQVATTHAGAIMADCRLGRAEAALGRLARARRLLDSALARLDRLPSSALHHVAECRTARTALPP